MRNLSIMLPMIIALGLTACGGSEIKKTLGLEKKAPDEFTVISKPPLAIPPNFTLRPPKPGAVRPQNLDPNLQAQKSVFGSDPEKPGQMTRFMAAGNAPISKSPGEISLLQLAGIDQRDSNIRELLKQETSVLTEREARFVDQLIFWQDPEEPGIVIDPAAEARRIQENQAIGEPVTEGNTPIIRRRSKAILEGIFN
jgi:hypothetical protein